MEQGTKKNFNECKSNYDIKQASTFVILKMTLN